MCLCFALQTSCMCITLLSILASVLDCMCLSKTMETASATIDNEALSNSHKGAYKCVNQRNSVLSFGWQMHAQSCTAGMCSIQHIWQKLYQVLCIWHGAGALQQQQMDLATDLSSVEREMLRLDGVQVDLKLMKTSNTVSTLSCPVQS